jgi:hypothetical protein
VCTVYQKNTVINIAVTPLLSAWRPNNYQAKAVIVLIYPWPDIADTSTTHALNATKMVAIFQKIICMRKIKKQKKTTFTA